MDLKKQISSLLYITWNLMLMTGPSRFHANAPGDDQLSDEHLTRAKATFKMSTFDKEPRLLGNVHVLLCVNIMFIIAGYNLYVPRVEMFHRLV